MIVRDEANMIDGCLASVQGLVSEMIVVDTGSQDDTRQRARRAGAKVIDAEWRDDFAAARNVSLAHARGDWILVLDADERLVAYDAARLRQVLRADRFDCALLRLHDATTVASTPEDVMSGAARQGEAHRVPRLVRRGPHLGYVGAIHEDLGPWLVKYRKRVATLDLDIVHYGATEVVVTDRRKIERNERILKALATSEPRSPTALGYLAQQYLASGRLGEAWAAAEQGWQRLRHVEAATEFRPSVLRLAEARAQLQLVGGNPRAALDTVQRARRLEGRHYDLDYIAGYALETLSLQERNPSYRSLLLERARSCYETCLASVNDVYVQAFVNGATGWAAWARLGSVHLLLGHYDRAMTAFQKSLAMRPNEVESRLGLLEATLGAVGGQSALEMVGTLLACPAVHETPDFWVLAAAACESVGSLRDMETFLSKAKAQKPVYVASYRRMQHAERVVALALYRGCAVAGPGLVGAIGALVARQGLPVADVGAWASRLEVVRTLVANLARTGRVAMMEPLLEPRANVVVPGLTEHVWAAAKELGLGLVYEAPPEVVAVFGEDAPFVAEMLGTHPRLRGHVRVVDSGAESGCRMVDAGASTKSPGARAEVTKRALVSDPVAAADRLLAALGEGGAEPLVRYLNDSLSPEAQKSDDDIRTRA